MTHEVHSIDVEMFISEVHKFPELWDNNCEDNRYKNKKQQAWRHIAQLFIEDYDDLPEREKEDLFQKLNKRWRNIRDSYVRHLRRGKNDGKGYLYAKNLRFLDEVYQKYMNNENSDELELSSEDDTTRTKKRRKILLSDDITAAAIDRLRQRNFVKGSQSTSELDYGDTPFTDASSSYVVEDEDRSFFESLLPAVRRFDLDEKLEFRSEVLSLIKHIRSKIKITIKLERETEECD